MKNYFKAFLLLLVVYSCSPEELSIPKTLLTAVEPANSGTIARISQTGSDIVQLQAIPVKHFNFKGWVLDGQQTALYTINPIRVEMNNDRVITAIFEKKDTDKDGVTDDIDICPDSESGAVVDQNGCSDSEKDTDEDGVMDDMDVCPNTSFGKSVDENGCSDYQKVPTTPTNLTTSNITLTSVDLSWTASTDNFEVIGYDILINGILHQTVTGTTASVTGLDSNTSYNFTVRAKDAATRVSLVSNIASVTTLGTITLTVATDYWQYDISWNIKNGVGNTITSGFGTGTGSKTFVQVVTLTPGDNYTFTINDSFGDGLRTAEGYHIKDTNGAVIIAGGGVNGFMNQEIVKLSVSADGIVTAIKTLSYKTANNNNYKVRVK